MDPFENIFGKKPKKGYKFVSVEVDIVDNSRFKGFDISWTAQGVGFGHVFLGWGIDLIALKDYPDQQGFYSDTEFMDDEFVKSLMKEAAPKIAKIIINADKCNKRG